MVVCMYLFLVAWCSHRLFRLWVWSLCLFMFVVVCELWFLPDVLCSLCLAVLGRLLSLYVVTQVYISLAGWYVGL